jgi:Anthranilate/para-aminobenzoate synthases component I
MRPITQDDWRRWQREGCTRLPAAAVVREAALPAGWGAWGRRTPFALLESALAGRYTYICGRAERVIVGDHDCLEIRSGDDGRGLETRRGAPLRMLQALIDERRAPVLSGWPAMMGGLIALFGYDLVQTWEKLPQRARRDLRIPLFAAIEPRELFIYDHAERTLGVVVWSDVGADTPVDETFADAQAAVRAAVERWKTGDAGEVRDEDFSSSTVRREQGALLEPSFSAEAFQAAAYRIHDYIAAGDTYQVNLSRRTSRATAVAAEVVYDALRRVNPSPYMGLFKLGDFALVCGSPELLVKLEGGTISSRPIAGTRPRGAVQAADTELSAELFASEKERAEHLMLVDLIRNDIGRVAEFGSVHVPEFMVLERYSHVMHIVSQVEGRLAAGRTWVDVFESMFPGGTITGCPKIRTMEIIEELEPVGRGFYTGSLGWISYGGEMEFNIIIRSMLVQDGVAHVQAGAGVVADSNPERELDESTRKAQALWVALEQAEAIGATFPPA